MKSDDEARSRGRNRAVNRTRSTALAAGGCLTGVRLLAVTGKRIAGTASFAAAQGAGQRRDSRLLGQQGGVSLAG